MKIVTAVLERDGKRYTVTQDSWDEANYDDADDLRRAVRYMWAEGNYACDCNRLLFVERAYEDFAYEGQSDEDFPPCGKTIKLVSLRIEGDPLCVLCNGTAKDFDCSQLSRTVIVPCRSFPCPFCAGTGLSQEGE